VKFILGHAPKTAAKSAAQPTKAPAVQAAVVKKVRVAVAPAPVKVAAKSKAVAPKRSIKVAQATVKVAAKASSKALAKAPTKTTMASKTVPAVKTSWVQPKSKA